MNFIITKHDNERISTSIITDDENEKRVAEYLQPVISVINKIYDERENSAEVNDMLNYTVGYSFGLYVQKIINGIVHCFVDLGLFQKEDFTDIFDMLNLCS